MFDAVLIANRGEIARRVIRTLDRLGIASVAVHTPVDAAAPHVAEADRAVAVDSYLDVAEIVAAARKAGADALHPGYGFLSENPELARACAAAGIAFVGPPADVVALMGDKVAAKAAAVAAGLPVLESLTPEQAHDVPPDAYPLLVKAAAGGGGRGMRVVREPSELDAALAAAGREALAGFGDDRVFVERYLPRARHLEVQVIADAHGTVLHLGERECSLQRRHQKVIEEAPSPAVGPALRDRLGGEAVALATEAGYVGAGTVEFIADADDPARHHFLEMNARLQVEHPVTELVHGVDLVELQLRVAAGDRLAMSQHDIVARGHAIEARVTAEDAPRGFLPTSGRVLAYDRPPASLARVDDAIVPGSVITTDYDSLLAKVIVHGEDRPAALGRMRRALAATSVLGVTTSVGYLRRLVGTEPVLAGALDTGLVERLGPLPAPIDDAGVLRATAMLELADGRADAAESGGEPFRRGDGWRLGGPDARADVHVRGSVAGGEAVEVDVTQRHVDLVRRTAPGRFAIAGRGEWRLARDGTTAWVGHHGDAWAVAPVTAARVDAAGGDGGVRAPMPGQVLAVSAAVGDALAAGDPVLVLESMKMELTLTAPLAGTLAELAVAAGDAVALDQPLARIEPEDGAA